MVLKLQKARWTNIFTIEMFIFAEFVNKINFERIQSQRVGVALAKLFLFKLSSLRVLENSCFKARKVPWDE